MQHFIKFHGPWPAPAKLNLMLRILKQRTDGYHELQTVFQFIDYCDSLYFRIREDGKIMRDSEPLQVTVEQDLTVKAAQALQKVTNCTLGVDIILKKRLPIGGGLGGGSSNAATTLIALNKLWKLDLSIAELLQIGVKLGADVPVFIGGTAAWAEGIGEKLIPLALPEYWYLVLIPQCQVSTSKIFQYSGLTRNSISITIGEFLAGNQVNDCRDVVSKLYPEVAEALNWLQVKLGKNQGRLTGTGACVFAAFNAEDAAKDVLASIPIGWQGFVAKSLNVSPVINLLDKQ